MVTIDRCPSCQGAVLVTEACADGRQTATCNECGQSSILPEDRHHPNQSVGRFELESLIGQGSFGAVWKAYDPHLDRFVAIKIPRRTELDPVEAELFLREARTAAQVQHPNVVGIHEVCRDGDLIYLVCDLIEGESLASSCARQRMTVDEAVAMIRAITVALGHVHECGVIHRDLKPSNILLDKDGKPFLSDFGLARRIHGDITLTIDGQLVGTPAYMSPEQAKGDTKQLDERSDIYSLGAMLFELLTGELPFQGPAHSVFDKVINEQPLSPRKLNMKIPRDLETICLKCMSKSPAKRFASAAELAVDLDRFSRGDEIHSRPASMMEKGQRWVRKHPWISASIATIVCLVVSGSYVYRADHERDQANIDRHDAELMVSISKTSVDLVIGQLLRPCIAFLNSNWIDWLRVLIHQLSQPANADGVFSDFAPSAFVAFGIQVTSARVT